MGQRKRHIGIMQPEFLVSGQRYSRHRKSGTFSVHRVQPGSEHTHHFPLETAILVVEGLQQGRHFETKSLIQPVRTQKLGIRP